jgi:hypothetical protein
MTMQRYIIFLLLFLFTSGTYSADKGKIEVPLRFDRYYNYDEVTQALKVLNKAFPELTKLDIVGKSEEGRDIYALTINNPKTGDEQTKSGMPLLCQYAVNQIW